MSNNSFVNKIQNVKEEAISFILDYVNKAFSGNEDTLYISLNRGVYINYDENHDNHILFIETDGYGDIVFTDNFGYNYTSQLAAEAYAEIADLLSENKYELNEK